MDWNVGPKDFMQKTTGCLGRWLDMLLYVLMTGELGCFVHPVLGNFHVVFIRLPCFSHTPTHLNFHPLKSYLLFPKGKDTWLTENPWKNRFQKVEELEQRQHHQSSTIFSKKIRGWWAKQSVSNLFVFRHSLLSFRVFRSYRHTVEVKPETVRFCPKNPVKWSKMGFINTPKTNMDTSNLHDLPTQPSPVCIPSEIRAKNNPLCQWLWFNNFMRMTWHTSILFMIIYIYIAKTVWITLFQTSIFFNAIVFGALTCGCYHPPPGWFGMPGT